MNISVEPGGEIPLVDDPLHWPKPEAHLHVSTNVWQTSEKFDKGGPTVARALFDAVVQLEGAIHDLKAQQSAG